MGENGGEGEGRNELVRIFMTIISINKQQTTTIHNKTNTTTTTTNNNNNNNNKHGCNSNFCLFSKHRQTFIRQLFFPFSSLFSLLKEQKKSRLVRVRVGLFSYFIIVVFFFVCFVFFFYLIKI